MLYRIMVALLLVLLLSSCEEEQTSYTGDSWGNSASNIVEGGYITKAEDCYYFFIENRDIGEGLYRMDQAGDVTLLRKGLAYDINVVGDRIYYLDGSPGHICCISTNGDDFKMLDYLRSEHLYVNPSCMVYQNAGTIYIADPTGKWPRVVANHATQFTVHNDTIVYTRYHTKEDGIYQVDLNGSPPIRLSKEGNIDLRSNGKSLYYVVYPEWCESEQPGIYQIDEDGQKNRLPVEDKCWNMNAAQDYIFYRNQSEGGRLYRMDLDGTNQMCIWVGSSFDINVLDDFVLFRDAGLGLCTIKYDGSDLKPWTGEIEMDSH